MSNFPTIRIRSIFFTPTHHLFVIVPFVDPRKFPWCIFTILSFLSTIILPWRSTNLPRVWGLQIPNASLTFLVFLLEFQHFLTIWIYLLLFGFPNFPQYLSVKFMVFRFVAVYQEYSLFYHIKNIISHPWFSFGVLFASKYFVRTVSVVVSKLLISTNKPVCCCFLIFGEARLILFSLFKSYFFFFASFLFVLTFFYYTY